MDQPRTFTEAEHEAILTDAVTREVSRAVEDKDATIATLQGRVDVLEAEKAAADQARDAAVAEFDAFKAAQAEKAEVEARKADRVARIKEVAASDLPESYFDDTRVQRWAEMADDQFQNLLDDLAEASVVGMSPEEARHLEGLTGEERRTKIVELNGARRAREAAKDAPAGTAAPETAAFAGGASPSDPAPAGSTFTQFLAHRGRLPQPQ